MPTAEGAAALFNQLEQGRLDACGAAWLRGVGYNLLTHPGKEADGLRWLCFELCSDLPAPPEKTALVARLRQGLSPALLSSLTALGRRRADHPAFAEAAARWAHEATCASVSA